jgi:alkaline phosphatase D
MISMPKAFGGTGLILSRRVLLKAVAIGASGLAAPALIGRAAGQTLSWSNGDPFSLGVASGAPSTQGFVIWTRLAPEPLSPDPATPGGMPPEPVQIQYEVAADDAMREVVQRGTVSAEPSFAHTVHVDLKGLAPARFYWYRFSSGSAQSRIGRALTLPSPDSKPDRLRFGFVSCANYEHGYFSAYRHLADEHPDVVLFLGDYIYEGIGDKADTVRRHSDGVEAKTLAAYRNRYAQYRLDPDLQRIHAEAPSLITWDDHEVQNDYASEWSQTFDDPAQFLLRRAAAYKAFYEHMPLRPSLSQPTGPDLRLFDRFSFGDLAEFSMIDGRQYRSREACYGPPNKGGGHLETNESCPERREPLRTMIGDQQEAWLFDRLAHSPARWNVIGQDVLMAQLRQKTPDGDFGYWTDDWNGYPASRTRLLQQISRSGVHNPIILGGDLHSFWANDLKLDFDDPRSQTVATELVGTSIASRGPSYEQFAKCLSDNPHVQFFESRFRGYACADITRSTMTTRFRVVSDVTMPDATISTLKTFAVENGRPGAIAT